MMPLSEAVLSLLAARVVSALAVLVVMVLLVTLIALRALRGASPNQRPAILKALAELFRALR